MVTAPYHCIKNICFLDFTALAWYLVDNCVDRSNMVPCVYYCMCESIGCELIYILNFQTLWTLSLI